MIIFRNGNFALLFLMESKHRNVSSISICFNHWRNGKSPAILVAFSKLKFALIFNRFVINFTLKVLLSLGYSLLSNLIIPKVGALFIFKIYILLS
ncbi:hypothetical protein EAI25_11980 [Akkermansia muciniphila]|nr:hypothetical protein [Akkermansia muciniphila]